MNKVVAHIVYNHGASLYINDVRVIDDTDEKFGDPETGEFDIEASLAFLTEKGVTHVIDEELDWDAPSDHEYPLAEYTAKIRDLG